MLWELLSRLEQFKAWGRADELHALQHEGQIQAQRVLEFIEREEASGKLGGGRLGTIEDAAALDMLNPDGIFLGRLEGRPIFYPGKAHLLNYGPTQTGKGRDLVLTNMAHVGNRSVIVNDIKNGENAWASAHHRRRNLGHKTIPLNPFGMHGVPGWRLNPFGHIIKRAQAGQSVFTDCLDAAMSLVPATKGENAWVGQGAQEILAMWIEWAARCEPERCTLGELWRFVNERHNLDDRLKTIGRCGIEEIAAVAASFAYDKSEATTQYAAYYGEMKNALRSFRPGEPLADATAASDFDPGDLRHELTTVYLMAPERQMTAAAKWVSLTVSSMLETAANTPGPVPVLFLIDELANLPYMPVIPKALTLYAGMGVQLWGLCQGRNSLLSRGYKLETIKLFEEQAGVFTAWGIEDATLMRDVETWSGIKSVAVRTVNNSGAGYGSASFGLAEHKRPVLQSEEIRAIGDGLQLVKRIGAPLFVIERVPWFEVPRWRDVIRDVRQLHYGTAAPTRPLITG
ncbi:type IV secretory system conjugative DNA transfer family protein [Jiella marina]|uniref:type IV secretory system conjugative DNA transfer family protein n=1 Tax=Jiella sp. LLJ827 TaxID=2917712 RepID=UPI002100CDD2|nr:type IV secretory system conjugative DNA transfer family protein [Jiella sp. LLJ827]MCQ0990586.1 type IV secretory system conjugative DNA transfer family protein [Jiella sp. LLJ827]